MNFLPVVQRELRVAARQPRTHYTRMAAALVGFVIVAYVALAQQGLGLRGGGLLFLTLTQLAGWICLGGGVRLTADAISREKRDGTLGFLFLSHLSGLDVVLGKLVAQATWGGYALLATIPVMAIPFLNGGVQAGEFWFTMLALANTLFFSVCVGLWVSALSTDPRRSLSSATGVVLFFWLGMPFLAQLATAAPPGSLAARVGPLCAHLSLSATMGLSAAFGVAPPKPWVPLLTTHGLAWAFLLWAAVATRRAWHERPLGRLRVRGGNWWRDWVMGGPAQRAARRTAALERTAFLWLLVRRRWKPLFPALLVGVIVGLTVVGWAVSGAMMGLSRAGFYPGFLALMVLAHLLFKFWIASEVVKGLTTQRLDGALESLVTTPLTVRDVVRAQFLAVWRQFGWPLLVVGGLTLGGGVLFALDPETQGGAAAVSAAVGATLALGLDTVTLVYLGTWLGLASRKPHQAAGTTAFRVLVVPWLLLILMIPTFMRPFNTESFAVLFGFWVFVGFGSDLLWGWYGWRQLFDRFRTEAARAAGQA